MGSKWINKVVEWRSDCSPSLLYIQNTSDALWETRFEQVGACVLMLMWRAVEVPLSHHILLWCG